MEKLWNGKWDLPESTQNAQKQCRWWWFWWWLWPLPIMAKKNTSNQEKTSYSDFPPKKPFHAQNRFSGLYLAICLETDFPHKRDKSKRGLRMDESRHYNSKNVGDNKSFVPFTLLPYTSFWHTLYVLTIWNTLLLYFHYWYALFYTTVVGWCAPLLHFVHCWTPLSHCQILHKGSPSLQKRKF